MPIRHQVICGGLLRDMSTSSGEEETRSVEKPSFKHSGKVTAKPGAEAVGMISTQHKRPRNESEKSVEVDEDDDLEDNLSKIQEILEAGGAGHLFAAVKEQVTKIFGRVHWQEPVMLLLTG